MLRPSPRLMLRLTTMVDMDTPATLMDTVPTATATVTPPTPDTVTTMARGPLMLRPSPRLMLRLTTLVDMDTPATLMDTVPTVTAPTPDTVTTTARGPLMLRPSPRLMLRLSTM